MEPILISCATFNRIELTEKCFASLFETADPLLYKLFIIDNASEDDTPRYLQSLEGHPQVETIVYNQENLGTAKALNRGWKLAYDRGQHAGKLDNDMTFYDKGWLRKMLTVLELTSDVGLVGVKRRDLGEMPNHYDEFLRSKLVALPNGQVIEVANHIIGSCWIVKHELLQKLGGLKQVGLYGLDDAILCHRAHIAEYATVFEPSIAVEHIDPGDPKYPVYTQWKRDYAGEVMKSGAYDALMEAYRTGTRDVKEPFDVS